MPVEPDMVLGVRSRRPGRAWTEWFSEGIQELAAKDKRVMAITAAMPDGTGLMKFRERFPDRFIDAGIAEQHAIAFSSGLAIAGLRPVAAIYSTFLQRGYDQVFQEVALQNLPVMFAIDRAGLVGEDGYSHHGLFDIAFLRAFPNMTLMAPKDGPELKAMLHFAMTLEGPCAMWRRRSAIIVQLRFKEHTDTELLCHAIEASMDSKEFFLRKAIGWALREHSKSDPDIVVEFVTAHADELSGLSKREALKVLKKKGVVEGVGWHQAD